MIRKYIPARDLVKPDPNLFLIGEDSPKRLEKQANDSFFVRGFTYSKVDKDLATEKGINFLDIPGDLLDILEGWDVSYNRDSRPVAGWNFDIAELKSTMYNWNEGNASRLYDYMTQNFTSVSTLLDYEHEYYEQRCLINEFNFHADLYKTRDMYVDICSSEPLKKHETNTLREQKFAKHVGAIYRMYKIYSAKGWSKFKSIPVLELADGKYMIMDQCTLAVAAGFADIDVQIDVVLQEQIS